MLCQKLKKKHDTHLTGHARHPLVSSADEHVVLNIIVRWGASSRHSISLNVTEKISPVVLKCHTFKTEGGKCKSKISINCGLNLTEQKNKKQDQSRAS